jgi:hypothetical protein
VLAARHASVQPAAAAAAAAPAALCCRMVHAEVFHSRWAMLGAAGIMLTSVSGLACVRATGCCGGGACLLCWCAMAAPAGAAALSNPPHAAAAAHVAAACCTRTRHRLVLQSACRSPSGLRPARRLTSATGASVGCCCCCCGGAEDTRAHARLPHTRLLSVHVPCNQHTAQKRHSAPAPSCRADTAASPMHALPRLQARC